MIQWVRHYPESESSGVTISVSVKFDGDTSPVEISPVLEVPPLYLKRAEQLVISIAEDGRIKFLVMNLVEELSSIDEVFEDKPDLGGGQ